MSTGPQQHECGRKHSWPLAELATQIILINPQTVGATLTRVQILPLSLIDGVTCILVWLWWSQFTLTTPGELLIEVFSKVFQFELEFIWRLINSNTQLSSLCPGFLWVLQ